MKIAQEHFKEIEVNKVADPSFQRIRITQSETRHIDIELENIPELIKTLLKQGVSTENKEAFIQELTELK